MDSRSELHAPAASPRDKKLPLYIAQRLGGSLRRSGQHADCCQSNTTAWAASWLIEKTLTAVICLLLNRKIWRDNKELL